ncbi:hypothetical protein P9695_14805 [Weizmannia sp. CD-2023]|uniref:hypothetical protein n=1 Tax=Heyndrickxia TaxID=2837504 RepID=UPI002E1C0C4A|nr:hypothetical protein [Weizmannia sp. CD-2023]MED4899767.1 hypothetical protein [Weizmannia sp. CD-2023]
MGVITGKGKEIKKHIKPKDDGEKLDYKKIKINKDLKKEGDLVRVRVLSDEDYTTYESHGSFTNGIYTTPCTNPRDTSGNPLNKDGRCLYCEAVEHGFEEGELKSKTRFLFAFYDIDMEMVRVLEVSYNQGISLIGDIDTYAEDIDEYAFELKRKGTGTKTAYTLQPILKLRGDDKKRFDSAEGQKVDEDLFEKVLYVKNLNQQAVDLENAGFDVEKELGFEIKDETKQGEEIEKDYGKDIDPEKVF